MKIERKKVEELKQAPYNPRQMTDEQYDSLKKSIQKFGYVDLIVYNKKSGNVVGGNYRLRALKELGKKKEKVIQVNVDPKTEKVLNLALNKISGEWDMDKLKIVLTELDELEMNLDVTGFSEVELEGLLGEINVDNLYTELEHSEKQDANKTVICPYCGKEFEL